MFLIRRLFVFILLGGSHYFTSATHAYGNEDVRRLTKDLFKNGVSRFSGPGVGEFLRILVDHPDSFAFAFEKNPLPRETSNRALLEAYFKQLFEDLLHDRQRREDSGDPTFTLSPQSVALQIRAFLKSQINAGEKKYSPIEAFNAAQTLLTQQPFIRADREDFGRARFLGTKSLGFEERDNPLSRSNNTNSQGILKFVGVLKEQIDRAQSRLLIQSYLDHSKLLESSVEFSLGKWKDGVFEDPFGSMDELLSSGNFTLEMGPSGFGVLDLETLEHKIVKYRQINKGRVFFRETHLLPSFSQHFDLELAFAALDPAKRPQLVRALTTSLQFHYLGQLAAQLDVFKGEVDRNLRPNHSLLNKFIDTSFVPLNFTIADFDRVFGNIFAIPSSYFYPLNAQLMILAEEIREPGYWAQKVTPGASGWKVPIAKIEKRYSVTYKDFYARHNVSNEEIGAEGDDIGDSDDDSPISESYSAGRAPFFESQIENRRNPLRGELSNLNFRRLNKSADPRPLVFFRRETDLDTTELVSSLSRAKADYVLKSRHPLVLEKGLFALGTPDKCELVDLRVRSGERNLVFDQDYKLLKLNDGRSGYFIEFLRASDAPESITFSAHFKFQPLPPPDGGVLRALLADFSPPIIFRITSELYEAYLDSFSSELSRGARKIYEAGGTFSVDHFLTILDQNSVYTDEVLATVDLERSRRGLAPEVTYPGNFRREYRNFGPLMNYGTFKGQCLSSNAFFRQMMRHRFQDYPSIQVQLAQVAGFNSRGEILAERHVVTEFLDTRDKDNLCLDATPSRLAPGLARKTKSTSQLREFKQTSRERRERQQKITSSLPEKEGQFAPKKTHAFHLSEFEKATRKAFQNRLSQSWRTLENARAAFVKQKHMRISENPKSPWHLIGLFFSLINEAFRTDNFEALSSSLDHLGYDGRGNLQNAIFDRASDLRSALAAYRQKLLQAQRLSPTQLLYLDKDVNDALESHFYVLYEVPQLPSSPPSSSCEIISSEDGP